MRYTTILLSTLMLLAMSACKTDQSVKPREPVTKTTAVEVPLPVRTPFDLIPAERAAYLQAYGEAMAMARRLQAPLPHGGVAAGYSMKTTLGREAGEMAHRQRAWTH
jgi:hypothetical protein